MNEHAESGTHEPQGSGSVNEGLERVWREIKQISRQVEREARKTGRSARLSMEIRKLRRDQVSVRARLGKAVYQARNAHGDEIALNQVEGFAGGVAALDALRDKIAAKQAELDALHGTGTPAEPPLQQSEEVA